MTLEVLSTENMPKNVFVKQRIRDLVNNNFDDVFAAVCTPAQLEDFDDDAPKQGASYFRTYTVDIVSRNSAYLEDVFQSILAELQKLADDYAALGELQPDGIYTITNEGEITVNSAINHTHYRLPLAAQPAGTNQNYTANNIDYQTVGSPDANKAGWLPCTDGDPVGYKFKYNIAKDSSVSAVWPPSQDKISYAHLEIDGVSLSDALLNDAGIFWKENTKGDCPWPIDWVSALNPSPSGERINIVLDIIV